MYVRPTDSSPRRTSTANQSPTLQHDLMAKQSTVDNDNSHNHVSTVNKEENEELPVSSATKNYPSKNYSRR